METEIQEEDEESKNSKPSRCENENVTKNNNNYDDDDDDRASTTDKYLNKDTKKNAVKLIAKSDDIWGYDNFAQGCSFSPDGLCVLTSTANDGQLRLYNTPFQAKNQQDGWQSVLNIPGGECVRQYAWYPLMNSYEPTTCAFVAASRGRPIHLLDAYSGDIRASYSPYNALDEMESPTVVEFTPDGRRIFAAGFQSDRTIQVFDTAIPGREPSAKLRLGKTRRSSDGQKGLISAITFSSSTVNSANPSLFAVGTYSPGSIYVYDDRMCLSPAANVILNTGVCVVGHGKSFAKKKRRFAHLEDNNGEDKEDESWFSNAKVNWYQSRARSGITQLLWSSDSTTLYSASRRSDAVLAWDLRMLTHHNCYKHSTIGGIGAFERDGDTNQRLQFDFDDENQTLYVASQDSCIHIYDVKTRKPSNSIDGFMDSVNGLSYLPPNTAASNCNSTGRPLLAVALGSRRFHDDSYYDDDDDDNTCRKKKDNRPPGSIQVFSL